MIDGILKLEIIFSKENNIVRIGTPLISCKKYNCSSIYDLKKIIEYYIDRYVFAEDVLNNRFERMDY